MIDIHSHILPGIDDGAEFLTDSLEMAQAAVKEGIRTIVATPHHQNGRYLNPKSEIIKKVDQLNGVLQEARIDLHVLPGQESRIYGEILEDYEHGEILTVGNQSNYLFLELPSQHVPHYTERLLFDLQMKGLNPIIVHPERNVELIEQPDKLYSLVKNGVATQITASSVAGRFGKKIQGFTFDLIETNLTHFVASDAHNTHSRSFKMAEAYDVINKKYGNDSVEYFQQNAELLVDGNMIDRDIPEPIRKKKRFVLF